jgi:hypothetical protein
MTYFKILSCHSPGETELNVEYIILARLQLSTLRIQSDVQLAVSPFVVLYDDYVV